MVGAAALACVLLSDPAPPAYAKLTIVKLPAQDDCPATAADVGAWRDNLVSGAMDVYKLSSFKSTGAISDKIENCIAKDTRLTLPGYRACLKDLRAFARETSRLDSANGHKAGFALSDKDYQAGVGLAFPQMMQLPSELDPTKDSGAKEVVDLLSDPATYDQALVKIAQINAKKPAGQKWELARYTSRHLGTPDDSNTRGRIILRIPGDNFDQWLQFGMPTPDQPTPKPNVLSLVAVEKKDASGAPIVPPKARIKDFWRVWDDKGKLARINSRLAEKGTVENCLMCHKTGVLPFSPKDGSTTAADGATIEKFNQQIGSYGATDLDGASNLNAFGPTLGQYGSTYPDAFLDSCAAKALGPMKPDQKSKTYDRLRAASQCVNCHDGKMMNKLNLPMGLPGIDPDLIKTYLVDAARMPPGSDLSKPEREALYKCMTDEYSQGILDPKQPQGAFIAWLRGPDCPTTFVGQTNCPVLPKPVGNLPDPYPDLTGIGFAMAAEDDDPLGGPGSGWDYKRGPGPPSRGGGLCDPRWEYRGGKWVRFDAPPEGWAGKPAPQDDDEKSMAAPAL